MQPTPIARYRWSGHQGFPFRYGWPEKGVNALRERRHEAFATDEALIELGVGKNMVASIRHWGEALGLLERRDRHTLRVSWLGDLLIPPPQLDEI